jgi:hypothetical protein
MPQNHARPRPIRTAVVVAAALAALHVLARDATEAVRLRVLSVWLAPASLFARLASPEAAPAEDDLRAVADRRASRASLFADRGLAPLTVLDHRPADGVLIVAAGRDAGVGFGARVYAPEGLVGHVDRVETHLARVRLLSARGARAAVVAAAPKANLPGGLTLLTAVVEGDGAVGGHLVDGVMLEAFRPGDELLAFGAERVSVGKISAAGVRPRVQFAADAALARAVAVEGVLTTAPVVDVFEDEPLRTAASPALAGRGAFLKGEAARRLVPGAAIRFGGVYLGRVERAAGDAAYVSRREDPGHEIGVRLEGAGREFGARIRSEGAGVYRLVGDVPPSPPGEVEDVRAFTAGAGWLVPPGLSVGRFVRKDGRLIPYSAPGPWPPVVTASVFVFEAERAVLVRRRG